jgi:hypothetical protein
MFFCAASEQDIRQETVTHSKRGIQRLSPTGRVLGKPAPRFGGRIAFSTIIAMENETNSSISDQSDRTDFRHSKRMTLKFNNCKASFVRSNEVHSKRLPVLIENYPNQILVFCVWWVVGVHPATDTDNFFR